MSLTDFGCAQFHRPKNQEDVEGAYPVQPKSVLQRTILVTAGVRRDRTSLFFRMRNPHGSEQSQRRPEETDEDAQRLSQLHDEASMFHTSLVVKMAQYSGIVRFVKEQQGRAPPLEFVSAVPQLTVSIKDLFGSLQQIQEDLQTLMKRTCPDQQDTDAAFIKVCSSLRKHVKGTVDKLQPRFEEDAQQMQEIEASSPFFSPNLILIHQKLAAMRENGSLSRCSSTNSLATVPHSSPTHTPSTTPVIPFKLPSSSWENRSPSISTRYSSPSTTPSMTPVTPSKSPASSFKLNGSGSLDQLSDIDDSSDDEAALECHAFRATTAPVKSKDSPRMFTKIMSTSTCYDSNDI